MPSPGSARFSAKNSANGLLRLACPKLAAESIARWPGLVEKARKVPSPVSVVTSPRACPPRVGASRQASITATSACGFAARRSRSTVDSGSPRMRTAARSIVAIGWPMSTGIRKFSPPTSKPWPA